LKAGSEKVSTKLKIEAIEIRKTFLVQGGFLKSKKRLHALNGVSLQVRVAETVGIVGESGCGKTTLAEILLGLIKPTTGEVRLNGRSIKSIRRKELASIIQPVFQDPFSSLNRRKTINDIISLPLKVNSTIASIKKDQMVHEICSLVGLPIKFLKHMPHQLSGGQRQRVAIARALVLRPEIVLFDEPTSALDVSMQAQILNLLKRLQNELNLTYLLISHNLSVVEHMVDRVLVIYLGKIVEMAETEAIFKNPKHPYTRLLLLSVMTPEPGKGIPHVEIKSSFSNSMNIPNGCSFHPRCPIAQEQCKVNCPLLRKVDNSLVACHLA
jgi:peptide/nickel transport system ATP-binding protein